MLTRPLTSIPVRRPKKLPAKPGTLGTAEPVRHSTTTPGGTARLGVDAPIHYAKGGDVNIAYQVTGGGPFDLVLVSGFVSHLDNDWDHPASAHLLERLGAFARLIRFDKRGTGLSDRSVGLPDLETRMDDVRAVMDAAGSESAALFGYSEGGPMSMLFAATYPQRVRALVLYGTYSHSGHLASEDGFRKRIESIDKLWGTGNFTLTRFLPIQIANETAQRFMAGWDRQGAL